MGKNKFTHWLKKCKLGHGCFLGVKTMLIRILQGTFFICMSLACSTTRRVAVPIPDSREPAKSHPCNEENGERWDGTKCAPVNVIKEPKPITEPEIKVDTLMTESKCLAKKFNWVAGKCVEPEVKPKECIQSSLKRCLQVEKLGNKCFEKTSCDLIKDKPVYQCNQPVLDLCISKYNGGVDECHLKYDCSPER